MGADSTLVNMAYRAAMAKVPGDFSASFDKQYEGIIAANKAIANIGVNLLSGVGQVAGAYKVRRKIEGVKEQAILEAQELYKITDEASTTLLKKNAADNTYEQGEGLNPAIREAAFRVPGDIYDNITKVNKKLFKSKKDKLYVAEQYSRLENWKQDRMKDKTNVKQLTDAINSGLINTDNMDSEYKALLGQLINNKDDLSSKGINIYNRKSDDKLMVEFTPNRMESEYEYNKRIKQIDGGPSISQTQPVPPYSDETKQTAGLQTISFQELMDNVNYRELELQNNIYEGVTSFDALASKRNPKSKTFDTAEWDDGSVNSGKAQATKLIRNMFAGKTRKHISDLAVTDFFGTGSTYRNDLSNLVGEMDLSRMGIIDKGAPGYEDDLANDAVLKEEIVARLINPETPGDLKFAKMQMEDYYIDMAEDVFTNKRKAVLAAEKPVGSRSVNRGPRGKIDLGVSGITNQRIYAERRDVTTKYNQIKNAKNGDIIEGWDGKKTTQYVFKVVAGKGFWRYQVWDKDRQQFVTKGGSEESAGGGEGVKHFTTDQVVGELIPQTMVPSSETNFG